MKTLIPPRNLFTECVLQAEFYLACRELELCCTLEFNTPVGRIDAAIFNDDWTHLLVIVECKHNPKSKRPFSMAQINRYKNLGVPVFGLASMDRVKPLAAQIKRDYVGKSNGMSLLKVHETMKRFAFSRAKKKGVTISTIELDEQIVYRY